MMAYSNANFSSNVNIQSGLRSVARGGQKTIFVNSFWSRRTTFSKKEYNFMYLSNTIVTVGQCVKKESRPTKKKNTSSHHTQCTHTRRRNAIHGHRFQNRIQTVCQYHASVFLRSTYGF